MIGGHKSGPGRSWTVTLSVLALAIAAAHGEPASDPQSAADLPADSTTEPSETATTETEPTETATTETEPTETRLTGLDVTQAGGRGALDRPGVVVPVLAAVADVTRPTTPVGLDAGPNPDSSEPSRGRLVINAVGDVNVDPGYIPALAIEGYDHALSGMDGLFLDDDLTIINLECPASERGTIAPKQFNFRCDVGALESLKRLGVDVANQGNNHILDFGTEAMLDSLVQLRAAGIAPVGAGENAAAAHQPALFSRNGWTVAVLGFGGVVPGAGWIAAEDRPGMADGDTIETMVAAVEAADAVSDIVAVTIHWGVELQSGPPADDVRRAEAMIDAGADMIFGHHPHRLNALESYRDRPISWSLGNFVWPRLSAAGSDTAVAQVIVEPDGRISACYLDVTIVSDGHPQLDDPTNRSCRGPETTRGS